MRRQHWGGDGSEEEPHVRPTRLRLEPEPRARGLHEWNLDAARDGRGAAPRPCARRAACARARGPGGRDGEPQDRRAGPRNARTAAAAALETEVARLEQEVALLVEAIAKGTAYDAIGRALAEKDRRLQAARAELAALVKQATVVAPRRLDAGDVQARLGELSEDLQQLDGDRTRLALQRIFSEIVVHPLRGSWEAGWRLEVHERPWEVLLPRGAMVVQQYGCGGAILVGP